MPTPREGETREDWMSRCMSSDEARSDFPDQGQRAAFCASRYERSENMDHTTLTVNAIGPTRTETLMGQSYRVFPAVLVREKVLNNNLGRTFLPAEEIQASVDAWNGIPVVIRHPQKRGTAVSARSPEVLNSSGAGFIFNAGWDGERKALTGDVWLQVDRAKSIDGGQAVLERVEQGQPGELSTGFQLRAEDTSGVHNGERFDLVMRSIRPDHLALLVENTGACSVTDGCGLGVNHDGECDESDAPDVVLKVGADTTALQSALNAMADQWEKFKAVMMRPVFTAEREANMRETLIAQLAEAGPLTEDELAKLTDCQLKALAGANEDGGEGEPEPTPDGAEESQDGEGDGEPEPTPEDAEAVQALVRSLQERVASLEEGTSSIMAEQSAERDKLVTALAENDRCPFDRAELEDRKVPELRKLAVMAGIGVNYAGRGGPRGENHGDQEPDYAPVRPYWQTDEED